MVKVTYAKLFPFAACYISLPLVIFLATWLKLLFAAPLTVMLIVCVVVSVRSHARVEGFVFQRPIDFSVGKSSADYAGAELSRWILVVLALIALFWCFFGGLGGMWAQSWDWDVRNGLFRDLITRAWPVRYQGGSVAMSYYMGHWLPAAAVGRALIRMGVNLSVVWPLSNILLLLWTAVGMFLVELLAIVTVAVRGKRGAVLAVLMLIFFSAPDILGAVFAGQWERVLPGLHLEWWCPEQISAITVCLYWVFNQAVVPWICTLCFLNERSFRNYFFLWLCCAFCGPFPCVGLAVLMLGQGFGVLIDAHVRRESSWSTVRGIASIPNMLSLALAPIVVLFFLANGATSDPNEYALNAGLLPYPLWFPSDPEAAIRFVILIVVEALLLPILVARGNLKKPVYWVVALSLPLFLFIRVGNAFDFGMRATIPAVLVLYVLCARFMRGHFGKRERRRSYRLQAAVLSLVLLLGAVTPAFEFYRGFYEVADKGVEGAVAQYDAGSLKDMDFAHSNFGTDAPDDTVFYRYLAG